MSKLARREPTQLARQPRKLPERKEAFRWLTAKWEWLEPKDMATTHIFYTLRMIWNHSMPEEMRVGGNTRRYMFNSFYTPDYMKRAAWEMLTELETRKDLPDSLLEELAEMRAFATQLRLS